MKTKTLTFRLINILAGLLILTIITCGFSTSSYAQFYRLTITISGEGSVTKEPDELRYRRNTQVTITAIAHEFWSFTEWTGDASGSGNPLVITMTGHKNITANFRIKTYTLTYTAGSNGSISGTSIQTVNHGDDGTAVTAIADDGYEFVKWSDNRTDNPRKDSNVTSDISVSAIFSPTSPTATLSGTSYICFGESATLEIRLTGIGPWKVIYTDGIYQYELAEIASSTYYFSVSPGTTRTYTLGSVKDSYDNPGSVSGIATVIVNPLPAGGAVSGNNTEIELAQSTGTLTLSGHTGTVKRWERSLNEGVWESIEHTGTNYSEIPSSAGIWRYRAVVESGNCGTDNSSHFEILVTGPPVRLVLLEHFTNATDEKSIEANKLVNDIAKSINYGIANISYHTSFPNEDPINIQNTADPAARALYYGVSSAPFSIMDGGLDGEGRFDYSSSTFNEEAFMERIIVDPVFEVEITQVQTGNALNIEVEVISVYEIGPLDLTLQVAILETEVAASLAGLQGDEIFRNVVRKLKPDAGGTPLQSAWTPGQSQTYSFDWTIENVFDAGNLAVVAFIQNDNTREVYQVGASSRFGVPTFVDLPDPITGEANVIFYPNPATDHLFIQFKENLAGDHPLEVFNLSGHIVYTDILKDGSSSYEFNTENLPGGIYLFRIKNNRGILAAARIIIMN